MQLYNDYYNNHSMKNEISRQSSEGSELQVEMADLRFNLILDEDYDLIRYLS